MESAFDAIKFISERTPDASGTWGGIRTEPLIMNHAMPGEDGYCTGITHLSYLDRII